MSRCFLSFLLAILSLSCVEAPLEPVLPTSDVQLSIPLVNRVKYVYDFAAKDTALREQADGSYLFQVRDSFEPISIDTFSLDLQAGAKRQEIGEFTVDPPAPLSVAFTYQDLTGSRPPPVAVPIPPGSLSLPGAQFGPLSNLDFIAFSSGNVTLHVANNLQFPIQFVDPFVVQNNILTNPQDINEVARFELGGVVLAAGQDTAVSASLAGVLMRGSVRFPATVMSTPGTGGTSVTVGANDGIAVEFAFSGISADSASAMIPAQTLISFQDSVFSVSDSTMISEASFRSGSFDLVLHNAADVDVDATVTVKELIWKSTGLSYTRNVRINGLSSTTVAFDASQSVLQTPGTGPGTSLTFTIDAAAIASTGFRTVRSTDYLEVQMVAGEPLRIERLTGRIQPTAFSISSGASGSELGDISTKFKGTIAFDSLKVGLHLSVPTGFPLDYDLRLVAMNRKSIPAKTDSLEIPPPLGSAVKRVLPGASNAVFIPLGSTSTINSFLSKFFPSLPDTFIIRGSATINPSDLYSTPAGFQTVYDTTHVYGSVETAFPLSIAITGGELTDTVDLGDEQKFPKDFAESARSGTMYFEVTNGLPLSLSFRAMLIGSTGAGRDTLLRIPGLGPQMIGPPVVGPDGFVVTPLVTTFAVSLTGAEMERFNAANLMKYTLYIETADGQKPVKIRSGDSVRVKASANLVYTVNRQ